MWTVSDRDSGTVGTEWTEGGERTGVDDLLFFSVGDMMWSNEDQPCGVHTEVSEGKGEWNLPHL